MSEIKLVQVPGLKPIRILKWLVKKGDAILHGSPLAVYRLVEEPSKQAEAKELQLKSKYVGTVKKFFMQEGQVAISGGILLEIEGCSHPVVIKDMCAECGQDLRPSQKHDEARQTRKTHSAKVAMIPNIPELKISAKEAEELAQQDKSRLHKMKKLVLLVDLDQTLIHTTQDPGLAALGHSSKDFYSFQLNRNEPLLFTKLRPYCQEFLEAVSQRYELQIVTFGSRQYAHKIADFIDKEKKYFAHRILSRDECIHPFKKSGNLRHLFPCGDSMVCIIDDRDDVWNGVPNLIVVRKYNYFQGAGDINNPFRDKKSSQATDMRRKRKSNENIDDQKGCKDAKVEIDVKESKSEDSKSDVDEDLDMSSDSESSSDSSSESGGSSDSKSADNGTPASTDQVQPTNGAGADADQTSSAETVPISSQDESTQGSQDLLNREITGFSDLSQEFSSQNDRKTDSDDYLQFLRDILVQIHDTYYAAYDKFLKKEFDNLPDVRGVVPFLRSKVLYGQTIVFTGVIPQSFQGPPIRHRAYIVATQLGAKIEEQITDRTTHLVASKRGTTKYQDAEKRKGIRIVSLDWLWCCSERWERVEEKLFPVPTSTVEPLSSAVKDDKIGKGMFCDSKAYDPATGKLIRKMQDPRFNFMVAESKQRKHDQVALYSSLQVPDAVIPIKGSPARKPLVKSKSASVRSRKRSMAEIMGYQYSLSTDDIADMDREVDDLLDSSDEEQLNQDRQDKAISTAKTSSSSEDSGGSDDDEMEALLNAEMHFTEAEQS